MGKATVDPAFTETMQSAKVDIIIQTRLRIGPDNEGVMDTMRSFSPD
jgi:hypothetical protein